MELKDRLKKARTEAGLTQKDIEKNIPNLKQSTYSELERGVSKSTSRIVELANLFDVNVEWLSTGEGEMKKQSKTISGYTYAGDKYGEEPDDSEYMAVPQYDVYASCGGGALVGDVTINGDVVFKTSWLKSLTKDPRNLATVYAQGDSMSPTIQDGQVLLIDTSSVDPISSKIYIICIDGQLYIKRLINVFDGWIMRSDNPDKDTYPDVKLSSEKITKIDIQGQVRWRGGEL